MWGLDVNIGLGAWARHRYGGCSYYGFVTDIGDVVGGGGLGPGNHSGDNRQCY